MVCGMLCGVCGVLCGVLCGVCGVVYALWAVSTGGSCRQSGLDVLVVCLVADLGLLFCLMLGSGYEQDVTSQTLVQSVKGSFIKQVTATHVIP